jgi:hypothetical protein
MGDGFIVRTLNIKKGDVEVYVGRTLSLGYCPLTVTMENANGERSRIKLPKRAAHFACGMADLATKAGGGLYISGVGLVGEGRDGDADNVRRIVYTATPSFENAKVIF